MSVDPKIRARAARRLRERRERLDSELAGRRREAALAIPRLDEIDAELRSVMSQVALSALQSGAKDALGALRDRALGLRAEKAELLTQRGYPSDYLDERPYCPRCLDRGVLAGGRDCECFRELYRQEMNAELSAMLDLRGQRFDAFRLDFYSEAPDPALSLSARENAKEVYDECRAFADHFSQEKRSLFLNGATGLGKTFLSACIARTVSEAGFSVVYDTAVSIFDKYELVRFGRDDLGEARAAVERFENCDLLIMDDLGTEMTTAFTQSALYTLVNTRLVRSLRTVVNSNLSMEEIGKRYSPQIFSRLRGDFTTLFLFGKDIRLQKNP